MSPVSSIRRRSTTLPAPSWGGTSPTRLMPDISASLARRSGLPPGSHPRRRCADSASCRPRARASWPAGSSGRTAPAAWAAMPRRARWPRRRSRISVRRLPRWIARSRRPSTRMTTCAEARPAAEHRRCRADIGCPCAGRAARAGDAGPDFGGGGLCWAQPAPVPIRTVGEPAVADFQNRQRPCCAPGFTCLPWSRCGTTRQSPRWRPGCVPRAGSSPSRF